MRQSLTVPAEYASWLEGLIADAVNTANQDAWRRAHGHAPLIDELKLDTPRRGGQVIVFIGDERDRVFQTRTVTHTVIRAHG